MAIYVRTQEIAHEIGETGRFALRVTTPDVHLRAVEGGKASLRVKFELRAGTEEEADELFERVRFTVRETDDVLEVQEPRWGDSGIGSLVRLFGIGNGKMDVSVSGEVPHAATIAYDGVSADLTASGFRGSQQ